MAKQKYFVVIFADIEWGERLQAGFSRKGLPALAIVDMVPAKSGNEAIKFAAMNLSKQQGFALTTAGLILAEQTPRRMTEDEASALAETVVTEYENEIRQKGSKPPRGIPNPYRH